MMPPRDGEVAGTALLARFMPKADLHIHLEGALPYGGRDASLRDIVPVDASSSEGHFDRFRSLFASRCADFSTPVDFYDAVVELGRHLAVDRVFYAEVTVTLERHVYERGLSPESVMKALWRGATMAWRESSVVLRFIFDHVYGAPTAQLRETVDWCVLGRRYGVVGLGLAGNELCVELDAYAVELERAAVLNVPFVPHCGEWAGAERVRQMLTYHPRRLGHAVSAVSDPRVLGLLKIRDIAVECCFTSNKRLAAVSHSRFHPFRRLVDAGVPMVICSDDPGIFGVTLSGEYADIVKRFDLPPLWLQNSFQSSMRYALCDDMTRAIVWMTGWKAYASAA